MTYLELVEERVKKATPGPWGTEPGTYCTRITYTDRNYDYPNETMTGYLGTRDKLSDSYNHWERDAEFIAHARQDVPELLRMVRERDEGLEMFKNLLQRCLYTGSMTVGQLDALESEITEALGSQAAAETVRDLTRQTSS